MSSMFGKLSPWREMNSAYVAAEPAHATPITSAEPASSSCRASTEGASWLQVVQPGAQNHSATGLSTDSAAGSIVPPPTRATAPSPRATAELTVPESAAHDRRRTALHTVERTPRAVTATKLPASQRAGDDDSRQSHRGRFSPYGARMPRHFASSMILAAVLVMVPLARTPGSLPHDTPTTTAVITDDFLTLFPDGDASQDGFVSDGDEPDQTTIPATGDSPVTAGSIALAVVLTGVLVTANSRSRRPRPPRSGARSGPASGGS